MRSTKQVKYANVQAQTLVLIGFMGCGKTTVGRLLARVSGRRFVDLDAVIVARAGRSIPEIFKREGEARFRAREAKALRTVLRQGRREGLVVALGGGTVLRSENRELLQRGSSHVQVVWLNPAWSTLWKRLSKLEARKRPLLWDSQKGRPRPQAQIKALWKARRGAYRGVATRVVRIALDEADLRTVQRVQAIVLKRSKS